MGAETPRYAAFISYRHLPRDRAWAIRIMRALETFRTPKALRLEAFPDRLAHLFRDEDEIPASSDLSDQIKDALAHSDHLIVVCSPDTPGSRWVRREIELFQEMGRGDRIIPLLIAGEPDESFPPELRRRRVATRHPDGTTDVAWHEIEPIAADVRPRKDERASRTEQRAVLRLAAALLGCRYDDLARRDAERRRASLRNQLATGTVLLLAAALGGAWWWDANLRMKTSYCANYGERWAVPFCIGPLTESEQRARAASYRFHIQGGRVLELARVNGPGGLTDSLDAEYEDEPWTKGVALWRFEYGRDAASGGERLVSANLEGKTGVQIRQISYQFAPDRRQAVARFDRGLGVADRQTAEGSGLGMAGVTNNNDVQNRSSIGQHRLTFDPSGLLIRRDFEPVGGGATIGDALGAYGRAYEYERAGLASRVANLDSQGNVLIGKSGVAFWRRSYDRHGDTLRIEWLDMNSGPLENEQNIARTDITRDEHGN